MKFRLLTSCILSMLLVSSSVVAYADTPVPALTKATVETSEVTTHTNCSDPSCFEKFNSGIMTRATVIGLERDFVGEEHYPFSYSSGYLRLYIENTGSTAFTYAVKYPCGCKLVNGTLGPGKHSLYDKLDPAKHGTGYGHGYVGEYTVYVYTDDGSMGSIKVSGRTIDK